VWEQFAAEARALISLVDRIAAGDEEPQDFETVFRLITPERSAPTMPQRESLGLDESFDWIDQQGRFSLLPPDLNARYQEDSTAFVLDTLIDRWLKLGNVRLRYSYQESVVRPALFGDGTFSAIALQLATYATKRLAGELIPTATCSSCSKPYVPTRKPRADRDNFCQECGQHEPQRRASMRYREKRKFTTKERP
jgi:hypothetical protein